MDPLERRPQSPGRRALRPGRPTGVLGSHQPAPARPGRADPGRLPVCPAPGVGASRDRTRAPSGGRRSALTARASYGLIAWRSELERDLDEGGVGTVEGCAEG